MNGFRILLGLILYLFSTVGFSTDTLVFISKYLPKPDTVLVFTPKEDQKNYKHLPLVYMLHGYGGNHSSFNEIIDLQKIADSLNFIIVCPDGLIGSWYFDSPIKTNSNYESFFFNDLYENIIENYPIDTQNIFITGYSMGGHGAMYLFLRHNQKFKAAASSSGTLDLNYSSLKYSSLSDMLGEYEKNKTVFDSYSAVNQLDSVMYSSKSIFVDCGDKDYLLAANQVFSERCKEKRINLIYSTMPGRHNAEYWKKSFLWHFFFFQQQIEEGKAAIKD
jgi:putative tributyrin esterase